MEHTVYVISDSIELAESIAFLYRNDPDEYELASTTPEEAVKTLGELRVTPGHHRTDWLAKASVFKVTTNISPVDG